MDSGPPKRHRPAGTRFGRSHWRTRAAPVVVPAGLVVIVFALLLPPALNSPLIAIATFALLGFVGLVAAVGLDRSSTVMLVLAFGFAPLTSFLIAKPFVLASVLFAMAFGLALPRLVHQPLRLPGTFLLGAALFTAMGLIAVPLAISGVVSFIYLVTAVIALVGIPAAVVWMGPTDRQMYAMALAFGIGTGLSTLYGLANYTYRNAGFTYHPVALAYTAMLTLSFVPFLLGSKVRGRWVVVPPVALLAVVGVWTSGSRTSLVVLAALVLLIPVWERSIKLGLLMATCVVLVMPTILSVDTSRNSTSALSRLFGGGGATASDSTRLSTLRDGLEQVQQNPIFGNGYSTEHTYVIHNIYLQVLSAEGLIGLIGLLLIFAALVAPIRKAAPPRRALAYPALAVILAGPFQPNMADHYLGMSIGLSLVAAVGVMKARKSADGPSDAPSVTAMPQARV